MRVLVFGPQAVLVGGDHLTLDVAGPITVADAIEQLKKAYPDLATSLGVSRIAVNHEFASDDDLIEVTDEVALIGLISGG